MRERRAKFKSGVVSPGTPVLNSTPIQPSLASKQPSLTAASEPIPIKINGWWLLAGVGIIGILVVFGTRMTPENKVKLLYSLAKSFHQFTAIDDTDNAA